MNATKATFTKGRVAPTDDLDDTVCLLDITVELYDGKKKEQKKQKNFRLAAASTLSSSITVCCLHRNGESK